MEQGFHALLAGWESFYVIVGSVAGALIGLQFVVMALVADSRRRATSPEIAAFGTPTVLHFSAALLLSALASVPWSAPDAFGVALLLSGGAGVLYTIIVIRRARQSRGYQPGLEDWVWHAVLPMIAYVVLTIAGIITSHDGAASIALTAGVALALVFIGIHNSWDTITYVATTADHGGKGGHGRS